MKQYLDTMAGLSKDCQQVIVAFERYIKSLGYRACVHFELEACVLMNNSEQPFALDYESVNRTLAHYGIEGRLVAEYWQNQWEFVSDFAGQSPLKEAQNLAFVITQLPQILQRFGVSETLMKPIVWSGGQGQMAAGSRNIISPVPRAIHIPNAIQMNVSVSDEHDKNILPFELFGERLQSQFLATSLSCSLLFMPEEEAYIRLKLRDEYNLANELCSPVDISGGHQGSIALYKNVGKHNQRLGVKPLLLDQHSNVVASEQNWHSGTRVEHRLGSTSRYYNPYLNVLFALMNIVDALDAHANAVPISQEFKLQRLPQSLYPSQKATAQEAAKEVAKEVAKETTSGIELFKSEQWFAMSINRVVKWSNSVNKVDLLADDIGNVIKEKYLACFARGIRNE